MILKELNYSLEDIDLLNLKLMSLVNENFNLGYEDLDADKQSLKDRIIKSMGNIWEDIKDAGETTDAFLNEHKTEIFNNATNLLEYIKNKKLNSLELQDDSVNEELALYFEMYGNFNIFSFNKFIHDYIELITKHKIQDWIDKDCIANLLVARDNETPIPIAKPSLEFLDKIKSNEIRKWLRKDIKWAMVDKCTSSKFSILSVTQNSEDGTGASLDYFKIESKEYMGKSLKLNSNDIDNLKKLLEYCLDSYEPVKKVLDHYRNNRTEMFIKNELDTAKYMLLGPLAIRRIMRHARTMRHFLLLSNGQLIKYPYGILKVINLITKILNKAS